ncbi:unnamed protein product [Peronospora effusa]|nr:unnamed protein product [Peronospora effusa]
MTDEQELELDEQLASHQPLLEQRDALIKKKKTKPWYRHRLVMISGAVLLLLGFSYTLISSQISRIASKAITDTVMHVTKMDLSHPESTSVTLNLSLSLEVMSSFPATVDATTFVIAYQDVIVGSFQAPVMHMRHGMNELVFSNSTLEIKDKKAWNHFAGDMMKLSQIQYQISSSLILHVRLLRGLVTFSASDIPLHKSMTFKGMDGL